MHKVDNSCALAPESLAAPTVVWEEVNCLLCGGRQWSILIDAPDHMQVDGLWFAIVRCHDCGLCFTNPRPTQESIGVFYPAEYRPHVRSRKVKPAANRWRRFLSWRHGKDWQREGLPWLGQGRLLDFGCGAGTFLHRMHRQGWHVTGLDVSERVARNVGSELGLPVVVGSLPHAELAEQSFDVITMWHALEHVHEPLEVLRAAHRLLVPGGKLLVGVPNIDSLPFRWFGRDWFGLELPRHLTHFTPATLQQVLERAGFQVGPVQMIRHSDWLRSSASRACRRRPATRLWQRWLRSKAFSSLATWYSHLTRRSDCIHVSAVK